MRLIFIRHGDPNYLTDNLTKKGKREAALLAERVCKWKNITQVYVSPLGRAKATAKPFLSKLGLKAITYDWLQEFYYKTKYPENVPEEILPKEHFRIRQLGSRKRGNRRGSTRSRTTGFRNDRFERLITVQIRGFQATFSKQDFRFACFLDSRIFCLLGS